MKDPLRHFLPALVLAFLLAGLTGCADRSFFSALSEPSVTDSADAEEDVLAEGDFDGEDLEMQMCLDEELVALSQTGIWQKSTSPVSLLPSDSVVYDFPIVYNNQVEMYLNLFQTRHRKHFAQWLARSTAYREIMDQELAEAGLPGDLVYLAMIESGFSQLATSRANAVGLWQFMAGTGKQYRLRIDKHLDERRDPVKSTQAAVRYLSDLYQEFGDWHLAVAAYNGGPGRIRNGLNKYQVDNFWDLASKQYLPLETVRYVPKLIAALLIAKEPERYGFSGIDYQPPLRYDTIAVPAGLSLEAVALLSNSSVKEVKRLNLELRQDRTPPNLADYQVKIPENTAAVATKNLARLHSTVHTGYASHTIKTGETLAQISNRYGVNRTTLLKVNDLRSGKLVAGRTLRIPRNNVSYTLLPEDGGSQLLANKDNLTLHRVAKGETISAIAARYQVPTEMIVAWNGLRDSHSIQIGQQLALYRGGAVTPERPQLAAGGGDQRPLPAIRAEQRKQHLDQKKEPEYQLYSVRRGDSLWTISKRFSATPTDIKKWNNMKSDRLMPGNTLRIHKG
jgi:membrane-bound lytic murein transglycosylase D